MLMRIAIEIIDDPSSVILWDYLLEIFKATSSQSTSIDFEICCSFIIIIWIFFRKFVNDVSPLSLDPQVKELIPAALRNVQVAHLIYVQTLCSVDTPSRSMVLKSARC